MSTSPGSRPESPRHGPDRPPSDRPRDDQPLPSPRFVPPSCATGSKRGRCAGSEREVDTMLGRAVIAQGHPANVDEVVAFVRDRVVPLVDSLPGSHGLAMWVNRETGMIVVNTAWTDEAGLVGSNEQLASLRSETLQLLGASEARIEVLEPAVLFQNAPDQPGYWSRATETRAPV